MKVMEVRKGWRCQVFRDVRDLGRKRLTWKSDEKHEKEIWKNILERHKKLNLRNQKKKGKGEEWKWNFRLSCHVTAVNQP